MAKKRITWKGMYGETARTRSAAPMISDSRPLRYMTETSTATPASCRACRFRYTGAAEAAPHSWYRSSVDPFKPMLTKSMYGIRDSSVPLVMYPLLEHPTRNPSFFAARATLRNVGKDTVGSFRQKVIPRQPPSRAIVRISPGVWGVRTFSRVPGRVVWNSEIQPSQERLQPIVLMSRNVWLGQKWSMGMDSLETG
ncbi:MAG: hypothetical protein A4E42_01762 [Methanoregulaceae archaeon PtaU1.Bin222]|nr:MAG: hypothetical protein A4E42_01762 [Methanoregulaceae archaeon PtaU1.Bin222]